MNIFKNPSVDGLYEFNYMKEIPVGGMQTFLNYKNRKKKNKTYKINMDEDIRKSSKKKREKTIKFQETDKSSERNK